MPSSLSIPFLGFLGVLSPKNRQFMSWKCLFFVDTPFPTKNNMFGPWFYRTRRRGAHQVWPQVHPRLDADGLTPPGCPIFFISLGFSCILSSISELPSQIYSREAWFRGLCHPTLDQRTTGNVYTLFFCVLTHVLLCFAMFSLLACLNVMYWRCIYRWLDKKVLTQCIFIFYRLERLDVKISYLEIIFGAHWMS